LPDVFETSDICGGYVSVLVSADQPAMADLLHLVRGGTRRRGDRRLPPKEEPMATDTVMPPVHPGEILLEEFLIPLGVSQYQLAKAVDVPARRINEIVHGQRRITADTALRLSRYFGTSERFWMNLQARHDLETEKDRLGAALDDIRPLREAS
jgi:antitoxin HigA-1